MKKIKLKLKAWPTDLSFISLALLLGLAERGTAIFSEILKGPSKEALKNYGQLSRMKDFWDYYDELKNLRENSARTTLWRLKKKGLVSKKKNGYQITPSGLRFVQVLEDKKQPEESWDGKWRLVMFDIPEKKRDARNWLRWQLIALNYQPLQKSVFIGKQPIEEDIYDEIIIRKLENCIRLMTIGEIDNEEILNF